jgi:hypothetical protein
VNEHVQVGEFVEVFNNSKTDPAAWLAKVHAVKEDHYVVCLTSTLTRSLLQHRRRVAKGRQARVSWARDRQLGYHLRPIRALHLVQISF